MKRIFYILLAICFCISLTACGDPTPQEINDETVKMVLICEGDADEETSQAAAYATQLQAASTMMGLKEEQYVVHDGIADANSALVEGVIVAYIKDGYSIVFGTEAGYAPAMKKLAAEYPRVTFVQVGDADETLPNYYAYQVKTYEGAYLCGLVAGRFSENGKLGMIAADLAAPETHQMANAFLLGAQVRKPNATLIVASSTSGDYRSAVSKLSQNECEGVLVTVDSKDVVDLVKRSSMRAYTVAGQTDTEKITYHVTVQHRSQLMDTFQAVLSKEKPYYNNLRVGYTDGFLQGETGYEENGADVYVIPDAAKAFLSKGQWDVFAGVKLAWDGTVGVFAETPAAIKDTEGTVRIPAGAGIPANDTLNGMDWWMQGVTVLQ